MATKMHLVPHHMYMYGPTYTLLYIINTSIESNPALIFSPPTIIQLRIHLLPWYTHLHYHHQRKINSTQVFKIFEHQMDSYPTYHPHNQCRTTHKPFIKQSWNYPKQVKILNTNAHTPNSHKNFTYLIFNESKLGNKQSPIETLYK